MLTKKQHELLLFVHQRLSATGICPSFDEMKDALNLRSKSGIHRLITALEERGFIHRLAHRARALEVIKLPEPERATTRGAGRPLSNVIEADFATPLSGVAQASPAEHTEVPLYGRIAAGTPIEALRDQSRSVSVPPAMLGRGEYYALEVAGESMIDAGILDGDTVIIERCEVAENGVIVVALIDNTEVTLKRLRRKGNSVALEAANPDHETRIFGPHRVKVQGRLMTLLRSY